MKSEDSKKLKLKNKKQAILVMIPFPPSPQNVDATNSCSCLQFLEMLIQKLLQNHSTLLNHMKKHPSI